MAFGDKPTPPVKGSSAAFTDNLRQSAAGYKANGYSVDPLPGRRADEIERMSYPAIRWAVPTFVPEGLTIFGGPKSRGKSWIALDLALAVAGGTRALGSVLCDPGAVLYLALEDSERRIQDRQRAILQGVPAPRGLRVATEWKRLDRGGLDDIDRWIASEESARLVIIDVYAKVKAAQDAKQGIYDQDYAGMTPLYALARSRRVSIVPVHHNNKIGADDPVMRISGTVGFTGAADTTLVLDRKASAQQGELHVRGRDVPERSVALSFDSLTGCCTMLGPAEDYRKSEERRTIIGYLKEAGMPQTPVQIAAEIGKNRATIRKILSRMLSAGEISRLPNGKYYPKGERT